MYICKYIYVYIYTVCIWYSKIQIYTDIVQMVCIYIIIYIAYM